MSVSNNNLTSANSSDKNDDHIPDKTENVIRCVTAIVLCLIILAITLTSRNIYRYLCRQKKYRQTLITSFYVTLSGLLLSALITWSCLIIEPRFYDYVAVSRTPDLDYNENNRALIMIFAISSLLSIILTYAFNWVIVATV